MRYQFIPTGTTVVVHTNNGGETQPITLSSDFVDTFALYAVELRLPIDCGRITAVDIVGATPEGAVAY